jgi:hypothetical protein
MTPAPVFDDTRLSSAESHYLPPDELIAAPVAGRAALLHWNDPGDPWLPKQHAVDPRNPIEVYANHGRWVAECPVCHGAQLASRTDPRFFCVDCLNAYNGGKWVPLVWPEDVRAIEDALVDRATPHRNWRTGENVSDLAADNEAHAAELRSSAPAIADRARGDGAPRGVQHQPPENEVTRSPHAEH